MDRFRVMEACSPCGRMLATPQILRSYFKNSERESARALVPCGFRVDMWKDSGSSSPRSSLPGSGFLFSSYSTLTVRALNRLQPLWHAAFSLKCGKIQGAPICGQIQGHFPPRFSLHGSGFLFSSYSTLTVRVVNRLQPLWHAAFSLKCGKIQGVPICGRIQG